MTQYMQDLQEIQDQVAKSFSASGRLLALEQCGGKPPDKVADLLEQVATAFETATLRLRLLCERNRPAVQFRHSATLPPIHVAGQIHMIGGQWVHLKLNALLPHSRYQAPKYLTDTVHRLCMDFQLAGQPLPYFEHAVLIIEEHSNIQGRQVFDQDNKGWKAISNALKGLLFPDDDQYSLGVILLSQRGDENCCHITVLPAEDVADFFALRSGTATRNQLYMPLEPNRVKG